MSYNGPFAVEAAVTDMLSRAPSHFIDGSGSPSAGSALLPVFDPSTAALIAQTPAGTPTDIDRAVRSARTAFDDGRWRFLRPADRERILLRFADLVEQRGEAFAQLETLEQGKSINVSRTVEVASSIDWIRYVAGLATKITGRTFDTSLPGGPARWTTYTRREPIGVVAGIAPWNFPMMIALWKILPALASGCSIVLKPSELTPLSALMLAEVAVEAGVPAGVFNVVTGEGTVAGAALVNHELVSKISFTGSDATGRAVGHAAIEGMKRLTLELGGKNPAIVLADADLANVVPGLMAGAFLNGGQVCASASRVYAEGATYDALVDALSLAIAGLRVGPGMDPTAELNPLASATHRRKVARHIADARASGAEVRSGADVPDEGYFVSPALVLDPADHLQLMRDEVFGPLLSITRVANAEEALARANGSHLGLGASLWTRDLARAMNLVPRIEAGTVWVNSHVFIDPSMPFGGYKGSGIGRDFGVDWLDTYTEVKSVCFAH